MKRFTVWILSVGVVFAMPSGLSHSADSDAFHAQRADLTKARLAAEAEWIEQDKACKQRFAVTSCREKAQATRDSQLKALRKKELELNEAERQVRTRMALERLEQRQAEQAQRLDQAEASDRPLAHDQHDGARPASPEHPNGRGQREAKAAPRPSESQQQRAQEHRDRLHDAEQHRQEVRHRSPQASAKPLPTPQAGDFPK